MAGMPPSILDRTKEVHTICLPGNLSLQFLPFLLGILSSCWSAQSPAEACCVGHRYCHVAG